MGIPMHAPAAAESHDFSRAPEPLLERSRGCQLSAERNFLASTTVLFAHQRAI